MGKRPKFTSRQTTRHGKHIWYFRRYGRRIRLPDQFGTDEWWSAYDAAMQGKTLSGRRAAVGGRHGSFAFLVGQYLNSRVFSELAQNTQKQRTAILKDAAHKAGDAPPDAVTEQSIRQVMQVKPRFSANNFLKSMRALYKWALEAGYVNEDPTKEVKMNNQKTEGWDVWTSDYIKQFRDYWEIGTAQRRCFEIALATGLRRSDLIRLDNGHWKGRHIEIRAQKTGVECYIPMTREFAFSLKSGPEPFITWESGKPFGSSAALGNWFGKACNQAGIPNRLRLHSLRKTAASRDAENGWTANELMAKYGWLNIKEAELYTKQADRKQLALRAGKNKV